MRRPRAGARARVPESSAARTWFGEPPAWRRCRRRFLRRLLSWSDGSTGHGCRPSRPGWLATRRPSFAAVPYLDFWAMAEEVRRGRQPTAAAAVPIARSSSGRRSRRPSLRVGLGAACVQLAVRRARTGGTPALGLPCMGTAPCRRWSGRAACPGASRAAVATGVLAVHPVLRARRLAAEAEPDAVQRCCAFVFETDGGDGADPALALGARAAVWYDGGWHRFSGSCCGSQAALSCPLSGGLFAQACDRGGAGLLAGGGADPPAAHAGPVGSDGIASAMAVSAECARARAGRRRPHALAPAARAAVWCRPPVRWGPRTSWWLSRAARLRGGCTQPARLAVAARATFWACVARQRSRV